MAIEALTNIVLPPNEPTDVGGDKDWTEVEESLGLALPTDYKDYINLYGTGELAGCIWVYNPFAGSHHNNLLAQVRALLNTWRPTPRVGEILNMGTDTRVGFGAIEFPYPLYPEPGGLLPWGHVDNGAELFWQTSGSPEKWTVVISEARGPEFEEYKVSMAEFLVSLLSGRFSSEILPRSLQRKREKVSFIPLRE